MTKRFMLMIIVFLFMAPNSYAKAKFAVLIFEPLCSQFFSGSGCSSPNNEWDELKNIWIDKFHGELTNGGSLDHDDFDYTTFEDGKIYVIDNQYIVSDNNDFCDRGENSAECNIRANMQNIHDWVERAAETTSGLIIEGHSFSGLGVLRTVNHAEEELYNKIIYFITLDSPLGGHPLATFAMGTGYGLAFYGLRPGFTEMNELYNDTIATRDEHLNTDSPLGSKYVAIVGEIYEKYIEWPFFWNPKYRWIGTDGSKFGIPISSQLFLQSNYTAYRYGRSEWVDDNYRALFYAKIECDNTLSIGGCEKHSIMNQGNAMQEAITWIFDRADERGLFSEPFEAVVLNQNFYADADSGQCNGAFYGESSTPMNTWTDEIRIDTDDRSGGCYQSLGVYDPEHYLDGLTLKVNFWPDGNGQCDYPGEREIPIYDIVSDWSDPYRIDADSRSGGCQQEFSIEGRDDVYLDVYFSADGDSGQCGNAGTHTASLNNPVQIRIDTDNRNGGCRQSLRLRTDVVAVTTSSADDATGETIVAEDFGNFVESAATSETDEIDSDGDGITDVYEGLAGSDPNNPQDTSCLPPTGGDWYVTVDCHLGYSSQVPDGLYVINNAVLTIPSGLSLDMDLATHKLVVSSGSGVLIKQGGRIY